MNDQEVIRTLRIISKVYGNILDGSQNAVIPSAIASIKESKKEYERTKQNSPRGVIIEPWGYAIDDVAPLRFKPSKVKDLDLQVDVYCDIRWTDDSFPVKQEIKVRLWSNHDEIMFNPNRDSPMVLEKLSDPARKWQGRVVSRFHFDKANPTQQGPKYHMQIGGNPKEYELCWHPSSVNIPRLPYHPMELFLTCQMIAANFFWDNYLEIREKSEWRGALILCQRHLLLPYYKHCLETLQNLETLPQGESLLDSLWVN